MLTNALLYLIAGWVGTFGLTLFAFGDISANSSVVSAISTAQGYLHVAYNVLPSTTTAVIACFGVLIAFEISLTVYRLIKWGYSKIPGIT